MVGTIAASHEPMMTDITSLKTDEGPALFMGAPVYDVMGDLEAVLIFQINAEQIHQLMLSRVARGETYTTYLVGQDLLMRSPSREAGRDSVLRQRVDSIAPRMAFESKSGVGRITDYRGVEVLSAYAPLGLDILMDTDFDWAIITQIDQAEAFELLDKLRRNIFWAIVIIVLLVGAAGFFQSRIIARPINDLSYRIVLFNDGDLTVSLPESMKQRHDEIGVLMKTFNEGSKQFRKQIRRIAESTNLLIESISRISTTASQIASALRKHPHPSAKSPPRWKKSSKPPSSPRKRPNTFPRSPTTRQKYPVPEKPQLRTPGPALTGSNRKCTTLPKAPSS
jgi:methyl-accepting chemotaxis protein